MKTIKKFLGMGMAILLFMVFVIPIVGIIWTWVMMYGIVEWIFDEFPNKKKLTPEPHKSCSQIVCEMANKNQKWKEYADYRNNKELIPPTKPFDRKEIFDEVDKSNVRMSDNKAIRRDKKGRFIKETPLPITRYGVSTYERFKGQ
jgi:hypothetical protein